MQYIINAFNVLNISKTFCVLYTRRRVPVRRGFAENGQLCQASAVWRPQADRLSEPSGEFRPACPGRPAPAPPQSAVFRAEHWAGTAQALFLRGALGRERAAGAVFRAERWAGTALRLHAFRRLHAQQGQTVFDGFLGGHNQGNLGGLFVLVVCEDVLVVVEPIEALSHIHDMSGHDGRLILLARVLDHIWEFIQQLRQLVSALAAQIPCSRWLLYQQPWRRHLRPPSAGRKRIWREYTVHMDRSRRQSSGPYPT